MSFKITIIGAGSVGFTRGLISDILTIPEFKSIDISFTDINQKYLDMVTKLCQRDIDANNINIKIHSTTDRREALKGAKYVLNVARIGGLKAYQHDIDIPLKYGIDQCVGDTIGPGGIMYGQRGIAAFLEFCRDIREVAAPDCIMLNYANPNAMVTWACNTYGNVKTIGLCHGVQHGHEQIAEVLGLNLEEVDIICAGINHQTWYVQVKHNGEDMTGKLLEAFENHKEYSRTEKVRIDMLRRFGYYSTESNGHLSEYLPWYRKRPEEIKDWIDMSVWINGETGGYLRHCTERRNYFDNDFPKWMAQEPKKYCVENRGNEHASYIIEGLETGRIYRGHFNVINNGCITNLPKDAIIEVPGYVDANSINIPQVGKLPLGCAAICNTSISVQRLSVEAAVEGNDMLLKQAMMMDPLTGAVCNPPEIWQMVDEFLVAQEKWLPQYTQAIEEAKKRLKKDNLIPTKNYTGAARKKVKSLDEIRVDEASKDLVGDAYNAAK